VKTQDSAVYCLEAHRRVKSASSNMNPLLLEAIVCSLQFGCWNTQGALFSFAMNVKALCKACVQLACMNIDFAAICRVLCLFSKHYNVAKELVVCLCLHISGLDINLLCGFIWRGWTTYRYYYCTLKLMDIRR